MPKRNSKNFCFSSATDCLRMPVASVAPVLESYGTVDELP
jgi:hypothetical protein